MGSLQLYDFVLRKALDFQPAIRRLHQFTSEAFTGVLLDRKIAINMDGKAPSATTSSSNGCGAA